MHIIFFWWNSYLALLWFILFLLLVIINGLKQLREGRGLTQEQVAEKIGCDVRTVQRWEAGEQVPRFKAQQKLAYLYQVTQEDLRDSRWKELYSQEEVNRVIAALNVTRTKLKRMQQEGGKTA